MNENFIIRLIFDDKDARKSADKFIKDFQNKVSRIKMPGMASGVS